MSSILICKLTNHVKPRWFPKTKLSVSNIWLVTYFNFQDPWWYCKDVIITLVNGTLTFIQNTDYRGKVRKYTRNNENNIIHENEGDAKKQCNTWYISFHENDDFQNDFATHLYLRHKDTTCK